MLLLIPVAISGCADLSYYLHSINGHFSILNKTQDISDLLADENTEPDLANRLKLVGRIRLFALQQLHLPESDSYTIYADLKRSYALKNLFAAPEFSIQPHQWCYPIVGCAGYRGYFDETRLNRYTTSLKNQGFDVYVAKVSAYSTLGWFDDPVLNTFINWPEYRLAGMIFHELSHQQLYIDGDTHFNESFAVAVQQAGINKWLKMNGKPGQAKSYQQQLVNRQQVIQLIKQGREELAHLYELKLTDSEKREAKEDILQKLKDRYTRLSSGFNIAEGFERWFNSPINNAKLASVSTYYAQVPAFLNLLKKHDNDFKAFFKHVKNIGGLSDSQRTQCLESWKTETLKEPGETSQLNDSLSFKLTCLGDARENQALR